MFSFIDYSQSVDDDTATSHTPPVSLQQPSDSFASSSSSSDFVSFADFDNFKPDPIPSPQLSTTVVTSTTTTPTTHKPVFHSVIDEAGGFIKKLEALGLQTMLTGQKSHVVKATSDDISQPKAKHVRSMLLVVLC